MKPNPQKIVVATRNAGKFSEIREILRELPIEIQCLSDFPDCPEVDEKYSTYQENAAEKARVIAEFCKSWVLADDSGLEVEALGGLPGVRSARFAGEQASDADNNQKLLTELSRLGCEESPAVFRCIMVLRCPEGQEWTKEAVWRGRMTAQARGEREFGYDPLFFLPELQCTSAELLPEEKNRISHRAQALRGIREVLLELIS